jgi:hypothetical protein
MDPVHEDIRSCLHQYDTAVQEIREHPKERSTFGRYRAGAPYFGQYALRAAFEAYASSGKAVPEEVKEAYDRITRELEVPDLGGSRAYRDELYRDLVSYIEVYRTAICLSGMGMGRISDLAPRSLRQEIGILLCELREDYSLGDLEGEVRELDAALRACSDEPGAEGSGTLPAGEPAHAVTGSPALARRKVRTGAR